MKRNIAAAALLAAAFAVSAQARALDPQPSFQDSAPVESLPVGKTAIVQQNFPQPSFVDSTPLAERQVLTTGETVEADFPQGSFASDGGPRGAKSIVVRIPADDTKREAKNPAASPNG